MSLDHGRVVFRRIDLRADAPEWRTESLPHELTHVVLADRFAKKRIPPWVDEGIAMLAESPEKLGRRCNALQSKLRTGHPPTIQSTINLTERHSSLDADVFYGQSVGLVAYLLERGAPHQLLEFVESAQSTDYETAMRHVYGIEGWEILERGWREATTTETLKKLARHQIANDVAIFRQAADVNPLQATAP